MKTLFKDKNTSIYADDDRISINHKDTGIVFEKDDLVKIFIKLIKDFKTENNEINPNPPESEIII